MKRAGKYDVVIGGYYGFGNMGDDTVLCGITKALREKNPHVRIAVIAENREKSERLYGTDCIGRFDILGIIRAMKGAGAFILGGGSLFQNETSSRSLLYYTLTVRLSKLLCKSVYIFANGLGALRGNLAHRMTGRALRCADRVSVRDPDSFVLASRLCGDSEKTVLSADPIFLLDLHKMSVPKETLCKSGLDRKKYFVLSLRETLGDEELPLDEIIKFCREWSKRGLEPVFVPMQESRDGGLCRTAASACGGRVVCCSDSRETVSLLSSAEFAVGMRLHFLLMSLIALRPTVALSYDCKIDSSVPYAGGGHILPVGEVTAQALISETERAIKDTDMHSLHDRCLKMRALAMWDASVLCNALDSAAYSEKESETEKIAGSGRIGRIGRIGKIGRVGKDENPEKSEKPEKSADTASVGKIGQSARASVTPW